MPPRIRAERMQTGVRIERRLFRVLKALAEYENVTLGRLLEDIVLHAFAGRSRFDGNESRSRITALREVYGLDYDIHARSQLQDPNQLD